MYRVLHLEAHCIAVGELPSVKGSITIADNVVRNGNEYGAFGVGDGVFKLSSFFHNTCAVSNIVVAASTVVDRVILNFGGNQRHSNVSPALSAYLWKRTA